MTIEMTRSNLFDSYRYVGCVARLPRSPEQGDIYMVKNKLFLWTNNRWYLMLPEPYTLRQKIQVLIDNIELTDEQLIENIEQLCKEERGHNES